MARSGIRPVALMPCPPWRWPKGLNQNWRSAWWDMGRPLRVISSRQGRDAETGQSGLVDRPHGDTGLLDFLTLMSPVVSHEAELIRHVRALLPPEQTDMGMEADIWLNRHDYRLKLPKPGTEFTSSQKETWLELAGLLKWYRKDCRDILAEEMTHIQSFFSELPAEIIEITEKFNANIAFSLDRAKWQSAGFSREEFKGYLARRERRLPDQSYTDPRVASAWVLDHLTEEGELNTDQIPRKLPLEDVTWAMKTGRQVHYQLFQVQQMLMAVVEGGTPEQLTVSPLGPLTSSTGFAWVKPPDEGHQVSWTIDQPCKLSLSPSFLSKRCHIETTDQRIELAQITKTPWAREMGRNRHGLYVCLHDDRRFYWLSPGRYTLRESVNESTIIIPEGCWLHEEKFLAHLSSGILTPDWQEHLGEDQYGPHGFGLYEVIMIRGVKQIFRWIPPGRFQMGSPEGEPEREDSELLHEVEITQGFWLADTACTQALWLAVMGENPSHFKGEERPVERVSWENCHSFIERISREWPGLDLALPTEAQWEYACRADTDTPFWYGKDISTDQVNYHGDFPYAGGEKGLYRKKNMPVKRFLPNDWGLYQMHDNVLEWCADWYGAYENGPVVDPKGPDEGEFRVLRGGSWDFSARNCRSAYRSWGGPSSRIGNIGFRLSRGQKSSS